ncbi:MAG: OmpP1/FadL family transporter [Ferruginibacter sp.]
MKRYLPLAFTLLSLSAVAQVPEDALRYSYFTQNGTARNLAIGGAMGSLGGDISSTFINPAGLGNYKTGEFVFTPGFFLNNNRFNYRDTKNQNRQNAFGLGPIGLVFGSVDRYNIKHSRAFSLAFTQTANFKNTLKYSGYNNNSSFAEQFSEEISNSGESIDGILGNSQYAYGSAPALYTYLVDTFRVGNDLNLKAMPEFVLAEGKALLQEKTVRTKGGIYELAIGYASNKNDKLMFGGSLGIPFIHYNNNTEFKESDTSSNVNNNFKYLKYVDDFSTTGVGLNAKFGLIYRPKEYIRLGVAVHTPTYYFTVKDERKTTLNTDTEGYNGVSSITSDYFTNGQSGLSKYTMLTPWKVLISGSYVFREVENVRRQKAFITADIEYIHHRGSSFYSANEAPTIDEKNYYKALNQVVKGQYKGTFNFKVGGELKFNVWMTRLGFAYYTNPYKDAALKANRMLLSGGLGYRHQGFFIDLTYVHAFQKDVNFPYRLQDKSNTFAVQKSQVGNIVATLGIKF